MSSTSASGVKPPLVKRNSEDLQIAVRFDYSEAHFENEELDAELAYQKLDLHKAQYRESVKQDEHLKVAKKNAEDMLSLKKATKKRPPDEAVTYLKNGTERQKSIEKDTGQIETEEECHNSGKDVKSKGWKILKQITTINNDPGQESSSDVTETDVSDETKPVSTLTMFVLSMQKIRGLRHQNQLLKEEQNKREESSHIPFQHQPVFMNRTAFVHPSSARHPPAAKSRKGLHQKRRPATVSVARGTWFQGQDEVDAPRSPAYGLHTKKKDPRSRLQLEEISKLEQDSRFGSYDRFEQRRRRLLATEKDKHDLQIRIQSFLKNVDEFKEQTGPKSSFDMVLKRSSTTHFS